MGSWVGLWVPFSKLSRQKAIETCEILLEQRDRQIRRAEAAEAKLAAVEAERDAQRSLVQKLAEGSLEHAARLAAVEAELADPGTRLGMVNHVHARLLAAVRGETSAGAALTGDDQAAGHAEHCCLSGHPNSPRHRLVEPCTTRCTCGEGDRG